MENTIKSSWKDAVFPYIVYVMFFLGMGLTSGSIVHMPLDPNKYTTVLFIGMCVFVVASVLNEIVIDKKDLSLGSTIRLVIFSLCLSVGIGMISGGIQHFDDVAEYAAYLIPGGIVLSFVSFLLKNNIKLGMKKGLTLFTIVLVAALSLSFLLKNIASNMDKEDGHGHSHGQAVELKEFVSLENTQSISVSSNKSYYFTVN